MFKKILNAVKSIFNPGYKSISAIDAKAVINQKSHFLLDVRTAGEFAGGKIKGAINIPLDQLSSRIGELEKYRDKPILVNCLSGARSRSACSLLIRSGFSDVTNLSGGVVALKVTGFKLS